MIIEIDLNTVLAAVGVDILIGATALVVSLRNHRVVSRRVDRVEAHLHLAPLEAVKE